MDARQKITPYLWFNDNAEEAVNFYLSIFADSKILNLSRYPDEVPDLGGKAMNIAFQLEGQKFIALNGGPMFQFTEAISLFVGCETQEEVDELWAKLTADGGQEQPCAWLKDKFGLSWQIVPRQLGELLSDPDPEKSQRVMQAMLQMSKIDIATLQAAYDGV
ncbi:MAG: VOC family protein [Caldilineaceae bacterium]|nr:VOC family protein [Caldilineaceae bacterium]HRJ43425.1 VOC family protein [Caldilineaceae bacterium]